TNSYRHLSGSRIVARLEEAEKNAKEKAKENDWTLEEYRKLWPGDKQRTDMPDLFERKLNSICSKCHCKKDILWRNLQRTEPHFDACFRYFDDREDKDRNYSRCFVKRRSSSDSSMVALLMWSSLHT